MFAWVLRRHPAAAYNNCGSRFEEVGFGRCENFDTDSSNLDREKRTQRRERENGDRFNAC